MLLSAAVSGFIAAAGLIIAIGAQNAFVLRQGLQQRHVGLVVLVCMMGDIVLIIAGVAGIGALVQQWPWLLQLLRFGGAAFLAIYGLLAARRAITGGGELAPANAAKQHWRLVLLTALAFTFLIRTSTWIPWFSWGAFRLATRWRRGGLSPWVHAAPARPGSAP